MSLSLGEKLREAREERGISISEVAEQTRISPMYLESIENDDYKTLPGGIFNKGFVKSYAKYIGFDEQEALQDYSRIVIEAEGRGEPELKVYRPEVLTDDRTASSMAPTVIFAAVILALMTGGILFVVNYIQNRPSEPQAANNSKPGANSTGNSTSNTLPPVSTSAPAMGTVKIEFGTTGEPISLSSASDGKGGYVLVTTDKPAAFEPKESLRLSYSKSLASNAKLTLNGKQITLPGLPANPKRVAIELEITKDNLARIWESGQISFPNPDAAVTNQSTAPVTATPPSVTTQPTQTTANKPRPSPSAAPTVRATTTPAAIPRPGNTAANRP